MNNMRTLDSLDKELLSLLEQDARQSSSALAKRLGVSSATVRRRVRRLIENGALRVVGVVDPARIGLPLAAVIAFNVAHDQIDTVMEKLSGYSEVVWLATTTGRFDVIASARFPSTDALYRFIQDKVAKLEGVKDSETFVCLHVAKTGS